MATRAGVSIGIDDMIIPPAKIAIVKASRKKIDEVEGQYKKGIITEGERYNKIIDIWTGLPTISLRQCLTNSNRTAAKIL